VTNSLLVKENQSNYILFSDKFGEIYIKKIEDYSSFDNQKNTLSNPPQILYGHSDPIHILQISPLNNTILSADTFGKIKVCEFPNIFNLISVVLYKNEDIKFLDFLSNQFMIVLNSDNFIHLWKLDDFQLKIKIKIGEKGDDLQSIVTFGGKFFYVESEKKYYLYEFQEDLDKIELIKEIAKNFDQEMHKVIKSFLYVNEIEITSTSIIQFGGNSNKNTNSNTETHTHTKINFINIIKI
jgi:hypothetical protein